MTGLSLSPLETAVVNARVFDLEQPRRMHDPVMPVHAPGLVFGLHRRHEPGIGRRTSASGLICTPEHAGTHIDALSHQAEDLCLHGGILVTPEVQTPAGFTRLGTETIPPLIKPGVLLDLPRLRGDPLNEGEIIGVDELRAAADAQPTPLQPGAIVLIRTGFGARWADPQSYARAPGISREGSEWLASCGAVAVGADNVVWDDPNAWDTETDSTLPGHVVLLVRAGIYIVENLFLEELALAAPASFIVVCLPLKYVGGTGSPVRPIALVSPSPDGAAAEE